MGNGPTNNAFDGTSIHSIGGSANDLRATQRSLRLIRSDKKYAIGFIKGPYLDLGKDRDRFAEQIYEAALQY